MRKHSRPTTHDARRKTQDARRTEKLWGGRFTGRTDPVVERFTHSLDVDRRLARHDLAGSIAHARMLGRTGLIPKRDATRLLGALREMARDFEVGRLRLNPSAEDVHTAVQSELENRIGPAANRLHTARSRNDQAVTSLRLYCRDALAALGERLRQLQQGILAQAESARGLVMPGYTHLRHAQPVLAAHVLLSYLEMLERDRQDLSGISRQLMGELPLGSGALAGTGLRIDRAQVARELGFSGLKANSIDAVTDRDFVVRILSSLALLGVHLSRIAEELLLWSTREFGYLRFPDRLLTGSSMMPQKRNPDFLELIRAGSSRLIGNLSAGLVLLKGLPSGYHRDLQLDKEILFGALDRALEMVLPLASGFAGLEWNPPALRRQTEDESLYATDLAEYLVEKGEPFAVAHRAVGRLLADAERRGISLRNSSLAELRRFSRRLDRGALRLMDPEASVRRKRSLGSTRPSEVERQIRRWKKALWKKDPFTLSPLRLRSGQASARPLTANG